MPLTDRVEIHTWHENSLGQRVFGWAEVAVIHALRKGETKGRCIECKMPVTVHKASENKPPILNMQKEILSVV